MRLWRFVGTGALAVGTIAGAALAAQPTKEEMDFCDQKAAQVSKEAPVKPGAPEPCLRRLLSRGATRPVGG